MLEEEEEHRPINRANFRAKLQRRRRDSDQRVAMHPGSVNTALSAFLSGSLLHLSFTSLKAARHIKVAMDHISYCLGGEVLVGPKLHHIQRKYNKCQDSEVRIPFREGSG